jgi:hypothetical protein
MTYMQAVKDLKDNPVVKTSDGSELHNIIRRKAWPDTMVFVVSSGIGHLAESNYDNTSKKKKHLPPEILTQVTTREDLYSNDWEFISGKDFFK